MTHIWVRSESRAHEERVGLTPQGAAKLLAAGYAVTVEESRQRILPIADYAAVGCTIAPEFSWVDAPDDAIIFGLKELPEDGTPLRHRHIMFGHAYKGQPSGQILLERFKVEVGTLFDLEYLTQADGRRVAAFGYWAGYAGAAVALMCWLAQQNGRIAGPVKAYPSAKHMLTELQQGLDVGRLFGRVESDRFVRCDDDPDVGPVGEGPELFELFGLLEEQHAGSASVTLSVLEVHKNCLVDLLHRPRAVQGGRRDIAPAPPKLSIKQGSDGVRVEGAKERRVRSPEELLAIFAESAERRATCSHCVNAESSRSHLVAVLGISTSCWGKAC